MPVSQHSRGDDSPVVHVAMATFNGRRFIEQQVKSILDQADVRVTLSISDDGSTDGTVQWIKELERTDPRVRLLPARHGEPGLGQNFLYALASLNVLPGEYAAFSDQDDIWRPGKLVHQVEILKRNAAAAVSSNVLAFKRAEDGSIEKHVIYKSQPQSKWDFVFEAPGTGSSFLMNHDAWDLVVDQSRRFGVEEVWLHDWYVYALVRAAGMTWHIDDVPQVAYRQHSRNALGEHSGLKAVQSRFENLRSGKYRDQFLLVARDSARVARERGVDPQWQAELAQLIQLLEDQSTVARLRLLAQFPDIRRDRIEGLSLGVARLLHVW